MLSMKELHLLSLHHGASPKSNGDKEKTPIAFRALSESRKLFGFGFLLLFGLLCFVF